jgi:hypothetical protein
MLDRFLEVSYAHEQGRNLRNEMAEAMEALPVETLHKLASGQEKLAFGDEGGCWLDQFAGTPLYEQAIQLEEQSIKLKAQRQTQSREDRDARDQLYDAEDAIRLKKKMLELDMRKQEAGAEGDTEAAVGEEPEVEEAEPAEPEMPEEAMKEGSALRSLLVASMRKEAKEKEHHLSRATLGLPGTMAVHAPKGERWEAFKKGLKHTSSDPLEGLKSMGKGGLGGAAIGGLAGLASKKVGPGLGAALGGYAGSIGGALKHSIGKHHGKEGTKLLQEIKKRSKEKKSSVDPHLVAEMKMSKAAAKLPPALKATKIPKGMDLDEDGKKGEGKGKPAFMKQSAVEISDQWGRQMALMSAEQMEKEAFGALGKAIGAGLKGAGKFMKSTGRGVRRAYTAGAKGGVTRTATGGRAFSEGGMKAGLGGAGELLKRRAVTGAKRMGQFAVDNPAAAAALGGGALGTAALGGAALS